MALKISRVALPFGRRHNDNVTGSVNEGGTARSSLRMSGLPLPETEKDASLASYIERYWIKFVVISSIAGATSWLLFKWFSGLSSTASASNGLVLGVWGILLSLGGFALTIWQLRKTQTATVAATRAVNELKSRLASYDAVVEVQKAIAFVQETQRHIRIPSWESANVSYSGAREAVLRLAEMPSSLKVDERNSLSSILADIATISDKIDTGLLKGGVAIDRGRAIRGCREHEESLIKLSISFQREIQ